MRARQEHKKVGYSPHIFTWAALVVLTAITVIASGLGLRAFGVVAALGIAVLKSSLVLRVFMHLEHEMRLFKVVVLLVVGTIAVFIGLTFVDVSFR